MTRKGLLAWDEEQIFQALHRADATLSRKQLSVALAEAVERGKFATMPIRGKGYYAMSGRSLSRMEAHMRKVGLIKDTVPPRTATPLPSLEDAPQLGSPTWADVKQELRLAEEFFTTNLTGGLLDEMRRQPSRLWRDYDLDGLFKGQDAPPTMKDVSGASWAHRGGAQAADRCPARRVHTSGVRCPESKKTAGDSQRWG